MVELIVTIVALAIIGSLGVPLVIFTLARLGYFDPIEFTFMGHACRFAPKLLVATAATSSSVITFPRQAVFASAITVVITAGSANYRNEHAVNTGAKGTSSVQDVSVEE